MMYIFPRQFSLRNVFGPTGDQKEQFVSHGHAFREDEIFDGDGCSKLPKRLRGQAVELAHRLRARHARCSYAELLKHYCPTEVCFRMKIKALFKCLTSAVDWTLETRSLGIACQESSTGS